MDRDNEYLRIIFDRLEVCRRYKPKFGQGRAGLDYQTFREIYSSDVFYVWFGLDNPMIYSAHKAAGGITSIYRQIGLGSEELIRRIIQDELGLADDQANWSYQISTSVGHIRTLKLDARISPQFIANVNRKRKVQSWIAAASAELSLNPRIASAMQGIVFEIRQGYKSKDSKRQNADMANAAEAYTQGYLPVLTVMSGQIDDDLAERYKRGKWFVLRGVLVDDPLVSTFAFMKHIIGYDLASFFERNSLVIREFMYDVMKSLLKADDDG